MDGLAHRKLNGLPLWLISTPTPSVAQPWPSPRPLDRTGTSLRTECRTADIYVKKESSSSLPVGIHFQLAVYNGHPCISYILCTVVIEKHPQLLMRHSSCRGFILVFRCGFQSLVSVVHYHARCQNCFSTRF